MLGFRQKSCEYLYDYVCVPGKETESLKRVVMQDISKYPVHTQLFWHGNGENKKVLKMIVFLTTFLLCCLTWKL